MKEFQEKYKIGLALSGGGIKGLCHAGALKALEEAGIKPDIIAGTSAGAIVGALYGDGYNPDEICEFFRRISFREMTKIRIDEGGLFRIDEFEKFLKNKLRSENLEDLKIPLKIVASDLDNGKSAVFQSGNLLEKIIASSSVPVLFPPKKIDGIHYVDGGVFKNLPASFIRDECKILIGINASPMMTNEYKLGLKNVAIRSYRFMLKSNMFYDKELCDIMIEPTDMSNYNTFNTDKAPEIFEIGYISTKKILSEKYQLGN